MKTSLKRFFAGVAAAAMAVGGLALGATSAQAADSDASTAKGRLTVNAAKDATGHTLDTTGHKLKAYLVAAYNSGYQAYPQTDKNKPGQLNFDTFKYVVTKDSGTMSNDESAVEAALKDAGVTAKASGSASAAEEGLKQLTGQSVDLSFGYKDPAKDSAKERLFADSLAKRLTATDSTKWRPSHGSQDLTAGDGKFTADLDPEGLYLVVDSYTPAAGSNKSTQSVPMLVGTKFANTAITTQPAGVGEVNMKNTEVPVTKQVVETDNPTTPYLTPSYSLGDTVTFELSTTIPNYAGYNKNATDLTADDARKLVLTDTFEQNDNKEIPFSNPTVDPDGVKLYRDGKEIGVLTKDTDYTYATKAADGSTVTSMTFDFGKLVNGNGTTAKSVPWQTDDVIKIVLKATLNKNAVVTNKASSADLVSGTDKVGNANSVKVDFSDHTATGHHEVNGPTVNVYSFKFNLTKQYVKDSTKLPNAQFTIKNSAGQYLKRVDGTWGTINATEPIAHDAYGKEDKVDAAELAKTGIFVTDPDGEIAFNGLKAGKYTVHEIKAPKGYFQNALPSFDVKIDAGWNNDTNNKAAGNGATSGDQSLASVNYTYDKGASGLVTATDGLVTETADTSTVTVGNVESITELPKTGAAGIAFFSIIGVAIVAMAALFAVRARKAAKMA